MFGKEYEFLIVEICLSPLFCGSKYLLITICKLNQYFPVVVSAVLGSTQIGLTYHNSLEQVVHMQIIAMVILLFFNCVISLLKNKKVMLKLLRSIITKPNLKNMKIACNHCFSTSKVTLNEYGYI
jgi:hypothetical protein